ncbi:MAG TPA: DUF2924 domain-containing protein [Novosphingobium sp.]
MRAARKQLRDDIAALATMSLAGLREEWGRRYGAPPRHRSVDLLRRVLAWRMQADILGGFDAATRKLLEKEGGGVLPAAVAGTRLAREYGGRRHEVVVQDGAVVYEGRTFGSLSEVARHITGQRWNGPRFFGLRQENQR